MLKRLAEPARRAQERVLSAFSPRERETFLDLLDKFARAFNDTTRVPQVVQSTAATPSTVKKPESRPACPEAAKPASEMAGVIQPMWLLWFCKYQSAISSRVAHHTPSNFFA